MAESLTPARIVASARVYPPTQRPIETSRTAVAVVLLSLAGASLGLCAGYLRVAERTAFLTLNNGSPHERNLILGLVGCSAIFAFLVALLLLRASRERLVQVADLCAPLCLAGFIPMLVDYVAWTNNRLTLLVLLSVVVLISERLFTRSAAAIPEFVRFGIADLGIPVAFRRHLPTAVVVAGASAYAWYFSYYTLRHHYAFGTMGFDLGINVNWCFNALHGHPFRATVLFGPDGGSMLAGHAIYAVFFWLPFYALKPGAEVLLIYQSVVVALAAIPLYMFARTQLPRASSMFIALAYLLFAPLHGPNFYDFHELLPALQWHFLFYWAIATNRMRLAALIVPVLFAHREDVAVGVAIVGVVLLLSGFRPRFGAWLAVVSAVWFVIDKFVIMPAAGDWFFASLYKDLAPAGTDGYGPVVQTILVNPSFFLSTLLKEEKLTYFLHMFAPLVFLPLRRPLLMLLALPGFFFTLMTTQYHPTLSIAFQYTTHWIPYLFACTVLALKLIGQHFGSARQHGALAAVMLGVTLHSINFGAIFQQETFEGGFQRIEFMQTDADRKLYAGFKRLAAMIPVEASVAATETEVPHVAARINMYTLRGAHGDADYLLIRAGGVMDQRIVQEAFERNDYGLLAQHEQTFFLFKKNYKSNETRAAMNRLGIHRTKKHHG